MFRCAICQESLRVADVAAVNCGHTFHLKCLKQWLQQSKTCPSCRCLINCQKDVIEHVYLETQSAESFLDSSSIDSDQLEKRCVYLESTITTLKEEVAHKDKRLSDSKKTTQKLETEKREIEQKCEKQYCTVQMLKAQCRAYNAVQLENEQLTKQNRKLTKKLDSFERLNKISNGTELESQEAVENLSSDSFKEVKFMLGVLKDQLRGSMSQNDKLNDEHRKLKAKFKETDTNLSMNESLVQQLREEIKLLRTRPNQTPYNPALKEILKDTPIEDQPSPLPLRKRIKPCRLNDDESPVTSGFVQRVQKTAIVTSTPNIGDSLFSIDSPLDTAAFELPFAGFKRKHGEENKAKCSTSKQPDGLGGRQTAVSKTHPILSRKKARENASTSSKCKKWRNTEADASVIILD